MVAESTSSPSLSNTNLTSSLSPVACTFTVTVFCSLADLSLSFEGVVVALASGVGFVSLIGIVPVSEVEPVSVEVPEPVEVEPVPVVSVSGEVFVEESLPDPPPRSPPRPPPPMTLPRRSLPISMAPSGISTPPIFKYSSASVVVAVFVLTFSCADACGAKCAALNGNASAIAPVTIFFVVEFIFIILFRQFVVYYYYNTPCMHTFIFK